MISDSLRAKHCPPGGEYQLGGHDIEIGEDGLARLKGTDTIAGSTLNMNRGLKILVEQALVPFDTALNSCTINPKKTELVIEQMKSYGKSRRVRRDKWTNRMAIMGITLVVMFLAVAINIKGADLKKSDLEYSIREQNLEQQKEEEEKRTAQLQEYKIYVKTKQYAEEVAKEKLGLVNPDEILLKPTE